MTDAESSYEPSHLFKTDKQPVQEVEHRIPCLLDTKAS